jgi:hypothetical protein
MQETCMTRARPGIAAKYSHGGSLRNVLDFALRKPELRISDGVPEAALSNAASGLSRTDQDST